MTLLRDLIAINTYTGVYDEIIEYLSSYLKSFDCEIIIQEVSKGKANLIAKFGEPELVINAHMDTVPPSDNWTYDPLQLTKKNDRYYGLGTTDTKGNIYSVLKAVENIKPKNLMLLFSFDEESGSKTGVKYFIESEHKNSIKRAIVCEPTGLKLVSKHKSYYSFFIETFDKPQHSSIKSTGAIVKAAKAITKLNKKGFNIGKIEGGTAGNVVPQNCSFKTSIRSYCSISDILEIAKSSIDDSQIKVSFSGPPLINDSPMFEGEFFDVNFWTEAALFQEAGINSIVFGAGSIEQAHIVDEFVEISQLIGAQKVIEKMISDL